MKIKSIVYTLLFCLYAATALASPDVPVKVTTADLKNSLSAPSRAFSGLKTKHERGRRNFKKFKENTSTQPLPSLITSGFYPQTPAHFYDSSYEKKSLGACPVSDVSYVPHIGVTFTPSTQWNSTIPQPIQSFPNPGSFGVGPAQIISFPYDAIRSFDKQGNPDLVLDIDSSAFFSSTGLLLPIDYCGDIISQFDSLSQRWFVFTNNQIETQLFLAVSDGPIITNTTVWYFYTFTVSQIPPAVPSRPQLAADFPHMGIDADALYIAYDEFDNEDPTYVNCTALVIQKSSVLDGGPAVIHAFRNLFINDGTQFATGVNNYDAHPQYGFIIGPSIPVNTISALNLYRISDAGSTNPTISPVESIPINPIITFLPGAQQLGDLYPVYGLVEMGEFVLTGAVVRDNQLYACKDAAVDNTGNSNTPLADREGVLWWQYDVSKPTSALVQSGVIFDSTTISPPRFFFWAGIMVNKRGDVTIASSVSAADEYVNIMVAGRFACDPLGQMCNPLLVTNAQGPLNQGPNPAFGSQRFGEQTSVVLDPCDNLTMWAGAEWVRRQDEWAVQFVQLLPPSH